MCDMSGGLENLAQESSDVRQPDRKCTESSENPQPVFGFV